MMVGNLENSLVADVQFEKRGGLVPAIVQEADTRDILMLAYVNDAALQETMRTGLATFWSTSRNEMWTKGLTSGNTLEVCAVYVDCDQDALVYEVQLHGDGACHTKGDNGQTRRTCFYRTMDAEGNLQYLS